MVIDFREIDFCDQISSHLTIVKTLGNLRKGTKQFPRGQLGMTLGCVVWVYLQLAIDFAGCLARHR